MESAHALKAFDALSQPTRLSVFRLLMQRSHKGMAAGEIAETLNVRKNTLSTHLASLTKAGLIAGHKEGRSVRYRVNVLVAKDLIEFLMQDCCNGHPEICVPISKLAGGR